MQDVLRVLPEIRAAITEEIRQNPPGAANNDLNTANALIANALEALTRYAGVPATVGAENPNDELARLRAENEALRSSPAQAPREPAHERLGRQATEAFVARKAPRGMRRFAVGHTEDPNIEFPVPEKPMDQSLWAAPGEGSGPLAQAPITGEGESPEIARHQREVAARAAIRARERAAR